MWCYHDSIRKGINLKHCVNCEFHVREPVQYQNGQNGMASICQYAENTDPVDGSPLLCSVARTNENFCGLRGKYWAKAKEPVKAPLIQLVNNDDGLSGGL